MLAALGGTESRVSRGSNRAEGTRIPTQLCLIAVTGL